MIRNCGEKRPKHYPAYSRFVTVPRSNRNGRRFLQATTSYSFKCLEQSKYQCPIAVFFQNFPPPLTFEDNSVIFIIERSNVWIRHLLVCSNSSKLSLLGTDNCKFIHLIRCQNFASCVVLFHGKRVPLGNH